jgi:predicted RNA binding protein YcfA (HicA-like mRNA interferase family)
MKHVSAKDFIRVIQRHGWSLARVNGSHHIFTKPGRPERLVVPVHRGHDLKTGMLRHLLKVADIEESEL